MRAFVFLACLVVPVSVTAQATKTPPANAPQSTQTRASQGTAPQTKAAAQQGKAADAGSKTAVQQSKSAPADTKARPGNTRPVPGNTRPVPPRGGDRQQGNRTAGAPAITVAPEAAPRLELPPIMREVYDYDAAGRRDPFVSLLTSEDLRPMISDLRLVSILYDESGRRPIAVMRDLTNNTQYRVTTGSTLGRLKVAVIRRKSVIFSIEEFGLNRQDSLVLGDTTKARLR